MMKKLLIIGAKSDVAIECAKVFASNGFDLILAGRNIDELNDLKTDLEIRYQRDIELAQLDITDFDTHQEFYDNLPNKPYGVIVASGVMYEQSEAQNEWDKSLNTINVNFTGAVSVLNIIANDFENKKDGFIIGISSVAGDRGRKANYIYGSAKAGFSAYMSGLRNRLFSTNVQVLTVKPGFIDTKMTAGLDLPEKLTAKPEDVAQDIYNGYINKRNVIYTKSIWGLILLIIKHIPETIFKRLSI
jgi:short-subunit dehydrogenase